MTIEDYYIYGGFGVSFLFILVYLYIKDLEQSKRMALYDKSIEDLNLQLFKLTKEIRSKEMDNDFLDIETDKKIKEHVQKELTNAINQIVPILENVEHSIKNFKTEIEDKINYVENKLASMDDKVSLYMTFPSNTINTNINAKVLEYYKKGWSAEDISKELRIGIGEVRLILDMSGII